MGRRRFVRVALASAVGMPVLMACSPEVTPFKSTDVTGATFAQVIKLTIFVVNYVPAHRAAIVEAGDAVEAQRGVAEDGGHGGERDDHQREILG